MLASLTFVTFLTFSGGYGSKTFEPVQKLSGGKAMFPLILGRDFSGVVLDVGQGIPGSVYKAGDEVNCQSVNIAMQAFCYQCL